MIDFMLQQRIRKRENEIQFNKNKISSLEAELKVAKTDIWKRQIEQKIKFLKQDNEILEQKNRRRTW